MVEVLTEKKLRLLMHAQLNLWDLEFLYMLILDLAVVRAKQRAKCPF